MIWNTDNMAHIIVFLQGETKQSIGHKLSGLIGLCLSSMGGKMNKPNIAGRFPVILVACLELVMGQMTYGNHK
jgi:hypothetical protein